MTAPGRISLTAVSRIYETTGGTIRAIDGVSVEIIPGSSVGVMGPSGCGKSTLLGLIGGLDTPSAGTVMVGDLEVSRLSRPARTHLRRERFGFVFQNDNLLPFLTASENVALQLALSGKTDSWGHPDDLLADFGLAAEGHKLPDQLSGGQRQRVAVASALAHRPSVILADEPTGSLDVDNGRTVVDLLLKAQQQTGATLVVVSHDPDVCLRMSRTLTLRSGRLVDDTAPPDLTGGRQ
jgi:putative ABC transport system ATP-binding protein